MGAVSGAYRWHPIGTSAPDERSAPCILEGEPHIRLHAGSSGFSVANGRLVFPMRFHPLHRCLIELVIAA